MSKDISKFEKTLLIGIGTSCVGLGFIGAFVPLLPTTPFLLVAAACYARGSKRLYNRLLSHPTFGPIIDEWRTHRSMPKRAKVTALALVLFAFSFSTYLYIHRPLVWVPLDIFGVGLLIFIARIPCRQIPPAE